MSPAISSPPRTIEASPASPSQVKPIRDPQWGKVHPGSEERTVPVYLNYLDVTNFRVPCSEIGLVLMRVHRLPQVFVGLASLYVSLASTSALRWGEHDNSMVPCRNTTQLII